MLGLQIEVSIDGTVLAEKHFTALVMSSPLRFCLKTGYFTTISNTDQAVPLAHVVLCECR